MSLNFECSVCLEEIKKLEDLKQLNCDHIFCKVCINNIKKENKVKCPLCRDKTILEQIDDEEIKHKKEIEKIYTKSFIDEPEERIKLTPQQIKYYRDKQKKLREEKKMKNLKYQQQQLPIKKILTADEINTYEQNFNSTLYAPPNTTNIHNPSTWGAPPYTQSPIYSVQIMLNGQSLYNLI